MEATMQDKPVRRADQGVGVSAAGEALRLAKAHSAHTEAAYVLSGNRVATGPEAMRAQLAVSLRTEELLTDLLAEQRRTNDLLADLVEGLGPKPAPRKG